MLDVALGGATDVPDHAALNADDLPMRRLSAAVIERAIADASGNGSTRYGWDDDNEARIFRKARRWIFSDDTEQGSFSWWCQWLDLDPDYLRDGLVGKYGDRILEGV